MGNIQLTFVYSDKYKQFYKFPFNFIYTALLTQKYIFTKQLNKGIVNLSINV